MANPDPAASDRIIARAAESATLTVTARVCMVLLGIVFVPIGTYAAVSAWTEFRTMLKSVGQIEFEQRYQSLRLSNIEKELKLEAPPRWWERPMNAPPPPDDAPTTPALIEPRLR